MRIFMFWYIFCLFLWIGMLRAEEAGFSVRLTQEEQEEQKKNPSPAYGCCKPESNPCLEQACCCKGPSLNCPPLMPRFNPCDCIMDYYNPIIFNGFDLFIEALCWTVQQKSSTYALSPNGKQQPFPPSTTADSIGRYHSAHFGWSPGVRAGLSYTFERDAWNLSGQYTYFNTHKSKKVHNSADPTLYITATNRDSNTASEGPSALKSSAALSYQIFDFLLSRRFLPGTQILFDFFAGPSASLIDETWKVISSNSNVTTTTRNKWCFTGGGMRAGIDANWHIGSGFGLFNKLCFATFVGAYSNTRKTHFDPPPSSTLTPDVRNTQENETWVVPTTQLEFGFNWNRQFCRWSIMLQAAFEVNTWYDLHQFHQDSQSLLNPNQNHLDYRNASPVNLWGGNFRINFSF